MDEKITVGFERETFEALSQQAAAHGHSVDEEIRSIVERNVVPKREGKVDFVEWARRIRAMTPKGVPQTNSTQIIREDRDRGHSIDRS